MPLGASIVLLIVGAIVGSGGTILTQYLSNKYQTRTDRNKVLQVKRDEYAARFRPLMRDIISTMDKVQRRAVFLDGGFATDLHAFNPAFEDYSARLKAEPDCEPLVVKLVAMNNAAQHYAFIENHHWTLLTSLEPQAAMKTIDALNVAHQELNDALSDLSKALHEHMKLLDTPVI